MNAMKALLAAVTVVSLAGCSNMSGLGGSSEMTCSAPPGIPCQSVSGVYANATAGTLPGQRPAHGSTSAPGRDFEGAGEGGRSSRPGIDGTLPAMPVRAGVQADGPYPAFGAIRSEPTVIRIWVAPWEDADGDLHGDSYVYLQVDSGRWLIEHNRERIRREFAPMPAVAAVAAGTSTPGTVPGTAAKTTSTQAGKPTVPRPPLSAAPKPATAPAQAGVPIPTPVSSAPGTSPMESLR